MAKALRNRGFDVIHVQEINRKGKSDEEQLLFAKSQSRCLISFNVKDFIKIHEKFSNEGIAHFGIIVSKQIEISQTLQKLLNLLQGKNQDYFMNVVEFL